MRNEAQYAPLLPSNEQCHAPNSIMLVVSACSHVSHGGKSL